MYGSIELWGSDDIAQRIRDHMVANTDLTDFLPADPTEQLLVGFSKECEILYFQTAKLLTLFNVRNCKGSDLDLRLVDFDEVRALSAFATGTVVFSRANAVATELLLPAGTRVTSQAGKQYKTVTPTSIAASATVSGEVSIIADQQGASYNAVTGAVSLVATAFSGVEAQGLVCTNPAPVQNGLDQESDQFAVQRVLAKVRALNATSPDALRAAALAVKMPDGTRCVTTQLYENPFEYGKTELFVDNGTGKTESIQNIGTFVNGGGEVLTAAATAGQFRFTVKSGPIKIGYGFTDLPLLVLNVKPAGGSWATLTLGTDYAVKTGTGQIVLAAPLATGDALEAHYVAYTGLVREVQWTLDGRGSDKTKYPGGAASGGNLIVRAPGIFKTSLVIKIGIKSGYESIAASVRAACVDALLVYINSLGIGEDILLSMLYETAMQVDGVADFLVQIPAPADPANNIVVGYDQIPRFTKADITAV